MHFENKSILITGASSGIGKALSELLSGETCNLFLLSRRNKLIEENLNKLSNINAKIFTYQCDVSKKEDVVNTYSQIKKENKFIDIAILNAGVNKRVNLENYSSDLAKTVMGANFFGIVNWIAVLLPEYAKNKTGTIVGITSLADNRGYSGIGFYSASKSAASTYLEGLRIELEPLGIKVITVKPGFVKSELTDKNDFKMPFIMHAEKAAQIILRGIEKEKRIIQFPLRLVILVKFIGLLPRKIYEFFVKRRNR